MFCGYSLMYCSTTYLQFQLCSHYIILVQKCHCPIFAVGIHYELLKLFARAFHSHAPSLWNNVPLSVRSAVSVPTLRNIRRRNSSTWPCPNRYRHAWWPVDVTALSSRFCCWTLVLCFQETLQRGPHPSWDFKYATDTRRFHAVHWRLHFRSSICLGVASISESIGHLIKLL